MAYLKGLLGLVVFLLICFGGFLVSMKFHDGPMEIFAGGPFKTGEIVQTKPSNWSFLQDRPTLEFQTLEPTRSRITWLAVVDGRLFVPSGYMNTGIGKIWKHWPLEAEKDGRALLRIDDKIYPVRLVRVNPAAPYAEEIITELNRKYPGSGTVDNVRNEDTWLFEIVTR